MHLDIDRLRRDTPGCQNVIHLHHSGASLMPRPVHEAVLHHLDRELMMGGYEAAQEAAPLIESAYANIATLVNADPNEIALVESATVAWNRCFLALTEPFQTGDRVITTPTEYASNYIAMMQLTERQGVIIDVVANDDSGSADVAAIENAITARTRLICITHVPTSGAVINPAAAIGEVAKRHGVRYLLDACQSIGQLPIDVKAIGCHALSATGRKFLRGPRGSGFLFVNRDLANQVQPVDLDLHGAEWTTDQGYTTYPDAQRFEYFEGHIAGRIGLGVATEYANGLGLDAIRARITLLADYLRTGIDACPQYELLDTGAERSAIVTFSHRSLSPPVVARRMRERGINIGTSTMTSTRLDLSQRAPDGLVRAPVHYFNTHRELDRCLECLASLT
ncbi:MAG: aminotransferase class V-fold PLP-dependent enzyme [Pseudomonadota bacterium]